MDVSAGARLGYRREARSIAQSSELAGGWLKYMEDKYLRALQAGFKIPPEE
jgi:hypothetical protein